MESEKDLQKKEDHLFLRSKWNCTTCHQDQKNLSFQDMMTLL